MSKVEVIKLVKRNIVFLVLLIGIAFCVLKKDNYLSMPIVSHPDSQIEFSTEQNMLMQTWLSNVKEISEVKICVTPKSNFQSEMKLQVQESAGSTILAESVISCNFVENEKQELSFEFTNISVRPGQQYQIILSYENAEEIGILLLDAGSGYAGCFVDDEEVGQAAAFNFTFVKNSRIFWLLASFFPILGISLLCMIIFKRKWEETVGFSLIFCMLILFLFGLFGELKVGIFVMYVLTSICMIGGVIIYNKQQMTVKDIWSPGLIVYAFLIALILVNNNNAFLARWDEYSHWGLAAKDMFYFDSFSKHIGTTVMLTRYPPFATLIEYFFCYTNEFFSQSILYVGYQTVLASMLIIACKTATKRIKLLCPVLIGIIGIPVIFFYDAYNSVYVDCMLAALIAYVLFCYFSEKNSWFNWMRIAAGLFAITLTKEVGVALAGTLAMIIFADVTFRQWKERKLIIKEFIMPIVMILLVGSIFIGWQVYLRIPPKDVSADSNVIVNADISNSEEEVAKKADSYSQANAISASGISFEGMIKLLSGEGEDYQYDVIKNYVKVLFSGDTYQFGPLTFSYIDLFIIMILIAALIPAMTAWQDNEKRINLLVLLSFGMGTLYVIFLLITYLFSFPEREAVILHSYNRYLGTYLCGVMVAFYGMLFIKLAEVETDENKRLIRTVVLCFVAVLIIAIPIDAFVIKNMDTEITEDIVYGQDEMAEKLRSFAKPGDSVYFVCNNSEGHSYYISRNTISPLIIANNSWNLYGSKEMHSAQSDLNEKIGIETKGKPYYIIPNEWAMELRNTDYVFLLHVDESFKESYRELFRDGDDIMDGSFYKVIKQKDTLSLGYIGSVGIKKYR